MKLIDKTYTAWGFVDRVLIEGEQSKTAIQAVASWKREYRVHFEKTA